MWNCNTTLSDTHAAHHITSSCHVSSIKNDNSLHVALTWTWPVLAKQVVLDVVYSYIYYVSV